jgi:hypothetical protein
MMRRKTSAWFCSKNLLEGLNCTNYEELKKVRKGSRMEWLPKTNPKEEDWIPKKKNEKMLQVCVYKVLYEEGFKFKLQIYYTTMLIGVFSTPFPWRFIIDAVIWKIPILYMKLF